MGVVSRYFERLAAVVRPRPAAPPAVSADAEGLRIGGELVAWSDVRRLDAYKRDIFVGDLCLAILTAGSRVFEINEASPGWKDAGDGIERFLPGSLPHAEWTLRLIAADPGESVAIYPVTIA
ncbi:hypothetical protein [uncultured Thiodictyon sp.]|uniref:hypothetical protein n=1 Tax=uncultured Thiodictyon sp. TaxID=1846217 RepID=UPI0025DC8D4A|nr:hypothetical protein [uncultured Thiodictyon sp.]